MPEKLSWSSVTASQREEMANAAMGSTESLVYLFAVFADPDGACPRVSDSGTTRTIAGGCTDSEGTTWQGRLVVRNTMGSPTSVATFELDGFGTSELLIDGMFTFSALSLSSELTTTTAGRSVRVKARWTLLDSGTRLDSNSTLELVGMGYVDLSGQWDLDVPSGALELRGRELFKVDLARTNDRGCAPATLDGAAAGSVCIGY